MRAYVCVCVNRSRVSRVRDSNECDEIYYITLFISFHDLQVYVHTHNTNTPPHTHTHKQHTLTTHILHTQKGLEGRVKHSTHTTPYIHTHMYIDNI